MTDQLRYPPLCESEELQRFRRKRFTDEESLRGGGVSFSRHFTMSAACAPSGASFLTGHYPSLHGVTQTDGLAKSADSGESSPLIGGGQREIDALTSRADLLPTLLGFAGIDQAEAWKRVSVDHTEARSLLGRQLSEKRLSASRGRVARLSPAGRACESRCRRLTRPKHVFDPRRKERA